MLRFIYEDQRYQTAGSTTQRARSALLVMLDFVSAKLLEFMSWLFTATLFYLLTVVFYSNLVLYINIALRSKGLAQVGYTVLVLLGAAIFFLFSLLVLAYLLASLLSLFKDAAPSSGGGSKTVDKIKKSKVFGLVRSFAGNLGRVFNWRSEGRHRNLTVLLILSFIAFYHAWLTIPTARLKSLKYDFLPDFFMVTAKEIYKATYPYISLAIKYLTSLFEIAYKFVSTYVDKLF